MSRVERARHRTKHLGLTLVLFLLSFAMLQILTASVSGAQLGARKLTLTNNVAGATSNYRLQFTTATAGNMGSILIEYCSNSPFPSDPCTAPVGFTALGSALTSQSGITGFTIDAASTANSTLLTRTSIAAPVTPVQFLFTGVHNPTSDGTYFVRVQTFATEDAAGLASDFGGIAFAISGRVSITATVPPYLTFCAANTITSTDCSQAAGQYVQLGELSSGGPTSGTSQFLVATNAEIGYTVTISGPPMSSGINSLISMNGADISRPGTSQFGMNLVKNNAPADGLNPQGPGSGTGTAGYNTPDAFMFNSGDVLVSHPGTELWRLYTVTYLVNVPPSQPPGIYVTTLTYVALAQF